MSLEFPGGPYRPSNVLKKSQKCLFTEKKKISSILIIFGVEVTPMEKLGNPKLFCSRTPRGSVMGVSNFGIFGIPPIFE